MANNAINTEAHGRGLKVNLIPRIVAGAIGVGTVALLLVAGLRGEYALEYGVAFVGGLMTLGIWRAEKGALKWYETIAATFAGAQGFLLLYVQTVSPSPTILWAFGFGTSTGLIFGGAFLLISYALRRGPIV